MKEELKHVLEQSVLKDLVSTGVRIFHYQERTLYHESSNKILTSDIQPTDEEILKLIKEITSLFEEKFDDVNPSITIKREGVKLVALKPPIVKNLPFYLDVEKANFMN